MDLGSWDTATSAWERMLANNLTAPWLTARAVSPTMIENGGGVITFTSSLSGVRPFPGVLVYNVAKTGLLGLTESLAIEVVPHNIRASEPFPVTACNAP